MRYTVEVVLDDDGADKTVTARVDGRDIRQWESTHGKSFFDADTSFTVLTELAYFALVRNKEYRGTVEEFMDSCVGVKEMGEVTSPNPTKKGHTAKRS